MEHAQQLLSHLAPGQVAAVVHLMEAMLDPLSWALANAPPEDEEISEDEQQAVAEAREWLKHNKPILTCPCERCQSRVEFFHVSWFR